MPCYIERMDDGSVLFLCGRLNVPHCADANCAAAAGFLCDFPVGDGKTCDRPLCADHAHEVAPDIHYCAGHLAIWTEFKKSGRLALDLANKDAD